MEREKRHRCCINIKSLRLGVKIMNVKDKLEKIENMDKSINTELNKLVDEVRDCCL